MIIVLRGWTLLICLSFSMNIRSICQVCMKGLGLGLSYLLTKIITQRINLFDLGNNSISCMAPLTFTFLNDIHNQISWLPLIWVSNFYFSCYVSRLKCISLKQLNAHQRLNTFVLINCMTIFYTLCHPLHFSFIQQFCFLVFNEVKKQGHRLV